MSILYQNLLADLSPSNILNCLTINIIEKNELIHDLLKNDHVDLIVEKLFPVIFRQPRDELDLPNSVQFWYIFELTEILFFPMYDLSSITKFLNYLYGKAKHLFQADVNLFWLWKTKIYSTECDRPEFYLKLSNETVCHQIEIDEPQIFILKNRTDDSFFYDVVRNDAVKLFSTFFEPEMLTVEILAKNSSSKILALLLEWMISKNREIISIFDELVNGWLYYACAKITYDDPLKFLSTYINYLGTFLSENEIADKLKTKVETKINKCYYRRDIQSFLKKVSIKSPSCVEGGVWSKILN